MVRRTGGKKIGTVMRDKSSTILVHAWRAGRRWLIVYRAGPGLIPVPGGPWRLGNSCEA